MSQSLSALAIQPVNLNTLPTKDRNGPEEGSKAVLYNANWRPGGAFTFAASKQIINMLQQYNTGQFTTVQAVFIDNSTFYAPVVLKVPETGQVINCPPLSQGCFPVIAHNQPVFTVEYVSSLFMTSGFVGTCNTQFVFLNTAQRYYVEKCEPAIRNQQAMSFSIVAAATPVVIMNTFGFGGTSYMCLTGFHLSMTQTTADPAVTGILMQITQNGQEVWGDIFNLANIVGFVCYSKEIVFPARTIPQTVNDLWQLQASGIPPAGQYNNHIVWYFDVLNLQ